ncbi:MAG: hypothetical protein FJ083_14190 [Cyanobacteria bacterium K_Offshore_surface_m2_239]|nr:hypothetical protein [Cyanobacteria bacterium K_Offshore_surface_m2_239]
MIISDAEVYALTLIREDVLGISPEDMSNEQINMILRIIDEHMPPEAVAQPAPPAEGEGDVAQKERPDFIAGYRAGLIDGRLEAAALLARIDDLAAALLDRWGHPVPPVAEESSVTQPAPS